VRHIVSAASSETGVGGALQQHVLFNCYEIVGSEGHLGKQVENKERPYQEVAKGKNARTLLCLTMKTMDLKYFMLCFI